MIFFLKTAQKPYVLFFFSVHTTCVGFGKYHCLIILFIFCFEKNNLIFENCSECATTEAQLLGCLNLGARKM